MCCNNDVSKSTAMVENWMKILSFAVYVKIKISVKAHFVVVMSHNELYSRHTENMLTYKIP